MKNDVFIPTQNYQNFAALVDELLAGSVGVEMAAVIGRAGRGKTTSADRIVTQDARTVLIRYEEWMTSPVAIIREIAFRLSGLRPRNTAVSISTIRDELARQRRLVMVDEADRCSQRQLNALRDLHDTTHAPVLLIGEDPLRAALARESRLSSRCRSELSFGPVTQADLAVYYKQALGLDLPRELAPKLLKHCGGDFRRAVKDALSVERLMKSSGIEALNAQVVDHVCA